MTTNHAIALWGVVTDILLGHITDCHGDMIHTGYASNTARQATLFWSDGYSDPDFYSYMRGEQ